MKGSAIKRGRTWTAYWDQQPDPETGNRRQGSKGGFRTKGEAEAHLATVITTIKEGTYVEPSKVRLGRFLQDEWLPARKGQLKPLSVYRYERIIKNYIAPAEIGSMQLRAISGAHLNALYSQMERDGLSASTRRLAHAVLRRGLKDAVRWRKLARNPAEDADPPKPSESKAGAWSAREVRTFLQHVQDDRLAALYRLAATTGMRRGELLGLTWQHVALDNAELKVAQQLLPTNGGPTFGSPKSKRSIRTVALDAGTVDALRTHQQVQQLERDLASSAYQDGDLVFADQVGRPIYPECLTGAFSRHRKAAGIPVGHLHTLRHTHITMALTSGVPLHVVAARVGDRPETILGTYAHLLPQSDALAAESVAALVDGGSVDKPLTNRAVAAPSMAL
jgi:integrase